MNRYFASRSILVTTLSISFAGGLCQAATAPEEDPTAWKSSAGLGLTLTRGNSETLLVSGTVQSDKKWDKNELGLGANVTYGENSGTTNAESFGAYAQYNRLFNDRWFGYARGEGLHDGIADLDYRFTVSPGIGYYFVKQERTTLSGEFGPGYVNERLGGDSLSYFTVRFGERLQHTLSDRARLWQKADFLPAVDDWGNYLLTVEVGVEADITKKLSLRTVLQDSYRNEPAAGRKQNDIKLIAGVAYKF